MTDYGTDVAPAWDAEENVTGRVVYLIRNHQASVKDAIESTTTVSHAGPPDRVSPVLDLFARRFNYGSQEGWDWRKQAADPLSEAERQRFTSFIPRLIGTASNPAADEGRAWLATDWLVRKFAPTWLRAASLTENAAALEALPELSSEADAMYAMHPILAADSVAWRAAAGGAARTYSAASVAASMAAGGAAYSAMRSAAAMGAVRVGSAAYDVTCAAARRAAKEAAGPDGPSDHWALEEAEKDVETPTIKLLQTSALDLFDRMIDVGSTAGPAVGPRPSGDPGGDPRSQTAPPLAYQAFDAALRQAATIAASGAKQKPLADRRTPAPVTRSETVLRKTLHHPLIYFVTFVIVVLGNLTNLGAGIGGGLVAAIVVWFLTRLIP